MRKTHARGGSAQDRRRARRAATRAQSPPTLTAAEAEHLRALAASASGSASLPLGDRDETWDAAAAKKALAPGDYAKASFWTDPDADAKTQAAHKLWFASPTPNLHAVWKGVTTAAGAVQGARGGVQIPSGDVAAVKARIGGYYAKAAKKYGDDGIEPPWAASAESSAARLAALGYETADDFLETADDASQWAIALAYAEAAGDPDVFDERYDYWLEAFPAGELGGKPNRGTRPDRRLKANKPKMQPEQAALERFDAALTAAAGDVAWGPEDGFVDLLCDVNEQLGHTGGMGDSYSAPPGVCAVDASVKLDKVLLCEGDDYYVAPITMGPDGEPTLAPREEWVSVEEGWIEAADDEDDDAMAAAATRRARMQFSLRDLVFADGAVAPPMPDEHKPGERMPARHPSPDEPTPPAGAAAGARAWTATFVPEAALTDDGRAFAPGALTWRELPLTLMAMIETSAEGGHDGALVSGRIDRIWREGNLIKASGVFDGGDYGQEIARMVADGVLRGLSVDIAIHEYEVGPRADYFDEDGRWLSEQERPARTEDEPSLVEQLFGGDDADRIFVVTDGVIGMATVCPFPAFADANIALVASGAVWRYSHQGELVVVAQAAPAVEVESETPEPEPLTAAAVEVPVAPPAEWFERPDLDEVTPLTIDADGRVYGHAWAWETCHLAFDGCVVAPRTETGNAYFHLGEVECADGERLPVGKITLDAPHAGQRLSRAEAVRHYDDTGTVAAHVVCGEDEFGGWFAGAIHPGVSEEKLRLLRGSTISGDWRGVNGNLELVALLAVNVPGFPVPRTRALVASGDEGPELLALTAAGIVYRPPTEEEEAELRALAASAREAA